MRYRKTRSFASRLHIAIALFQLAYIYTPLHDWKYALPLVQWVTFPLLLLSGTWLMVGVRLWPQRWRFLAEKEPGSRVVPLAGFEPATFCLQNSCSTPELKRHASLS